MLYLFLKRYKLKRSSSKSFPKSFDFDELIRKSKTKTISSVNCKCCNADLHAFDLRPFPLGFGIICPNNFMPQHRVD